MLMCKAGEGGGEEKKRASVLRSSLKVTCHSLKYEQSFLVDKHLKLNF